MRIQVVIEEDMSTLHLLRKLRKLFGDPREDLEINIESRPMHQAIWSEMIDRILFTCSQAVHILDNDSDVDWGIYVTTDTFNHMNEKNIVVSQDEMLIIAMQSRDGRRWIGIKNIFEKRADPKLKDSLRDVLSAVVSIGATDPDSTDIELAALEELVWTLYEAACSAPKITSAMTALMT